MPSLPYLDELDRLLLDQPDCMLVSQLDGFLTGIVVSPDLIRPAQWIPLIWGGDDGEGKPDFESEEDLQRFLSLVMTHYNVIIDSLATPGGYAPVLETDLRKGDTLWEMWIDGRLGAYQDRRRCRLSRCAGGHPYFGRIREWRAETE